jgi:hypothetical protein
MLHAPEHPQYVCPKHMYDMNPKHVSLPKSKENGAKGQTEGKRIAKVLALTTLGIYNIRRTLNQQRVLIKNTVCFFVFLLFALGTSFEKKMCDAQTQNLGPRYYAHFGHVITYSKGRCGRLS